MQKPVHPASHRIVFIARRPNGAVHIMMQVIDIGIRANFSQAMTAAIAAGLFTRAALPI